MGSYYIPSNNLKGEGRFLYIFTTKSLIYTAVGAAIGFVPFIIFKAINMNTIGVIILAICAVIGYGIGTIKIPNSNSKMGKNFGGDSIDEIFVKYVNFKKNKKVYTYAVPRADPTYSSLANVSFDLFNLGGKAESNKIPMNKEEE